MTAQPVTRSPIRLLKSVMEAGVLLFIAAALIGLIRPGHLTWPYFPLLVTFGGLAVISECLPVRLRRTIGLNPVLKGLGESPAMLKLFFFLAGIAITAYGLQLSV